MNTQQPVDWNQLPMWLTTGQVADVLGVSFYVVEQLRLSGRIQATRFGCDASWHRYRKQAVITYLKTINESNRSEQL